MSFLPHYCHSFRITVIPSILLSFLPYYCHSFRIIVIPSVLVSFLPNIVIPSKLFKELQILISSESFHMPPEVAIYASIHKMCKLKNLGHINIDALLFCASGIFSRMKAFFVFNTLAALVFPSFCFKDGN